MLHMSLSSSTNSCMDDLMDEDEKDRAKRYQELFICDHLPEEDASRIVIA